MFSSGSLWELEKPERSTSINPFIQHLPVHPFNIYPSTHSTSIHLPIQHPSIHSFNIHPTIQHPSIHSPIQHHPATHSISIHPLVDASNSSQKPIHPSDPYVFTHHSHTFNISSSCSSIQNPSHLTPLCFSSHENIQWPSSRPDLREGSFSCLRQLWYCETLRKGRGDVSWDDQHIQTQDECG